jgi:hypothetical protein
LKQRRDIGDSPPRKAAENHEFRSFAKGSLRDDECRIRTENAPANFTTLKHVAHNLIRKAPGKDSLRLKHKTASWDDDILASLVVA